MLWEEDELVVDVSVGSLLDEWFFALLLDELFVELLLDASFGELSEAELVLEEDELEEVEEAWLVEGWDGWFDGLVVVEVDGWELEPWVGMARSPLAFHLPQSSG